MRLKLKSSLSSVLFRYISKISSTEDEKCEDLYMMDGLSHIFHDAPPLEHLRERANTDKTFDSSRGFYDRKVEPVRDVKLAIDGKQKREIGTTNDAEPIKDAKTANDEESTSTSVDIKWSTQCNQICRRNSTGYERRTRKHLSADNRRSKSKIRQLIIRFENIPELEVSFNKNVTTTKTYSSSEYNRSTDYETVGGDRKSF
ncbi:hypothetical protein SARC_01864 [Sphaeroforma arctica JP610]|uniref:Uncharacterized protein n=1 Tax=Sphaeroforma arctica JP610 TaxID=667725 RepID=A0A0L0GAM4_9EUKA|nr:hypothetical protein SARC_01864 [Sphaeroforma arctica JP610]KNC85959.1 hypothetical protein SARC_01864 [Sphaeroforma arctica JP610]|eukprot:XP_014159861.1 hypothetical protein SARC_01864 [Sphaeroforma arctica JP610]